MSDRLPRTLPLLIACLAMGACQQSGEGSVPGDTSDTQAYSGVAEEEIVRFTGTEPFWNGEVEGDSLTYSTPENIDGTTIAVDRFAGRNGLSFSGELEGDIFVLAVTPGDCSDGMSDRTYPFTATLQIGEEQRNGCAYTDRQGFTGPGAP